jgi:hypothetical protein
MKEVEPSAPKYVAQLEWLRRYAHKYWFHLLLIPSIALNIYLYDQFSSAETKATIYRSAAEQQLADYRGCRTQSPYGDPPLQVNFTDGGMAYVNFFIQVLPEQWMQDGIKNDSKAFFNAYESTLNTTKSLVYSILENSTLAEARVNREEFSNKVLSEANSKLKESNTGFTLVQFEFLEFCRPNAY